MKLDTTETLRKTLDALYAARLQARECEVKYNVDMTPVKNAVTRAQQEIGRLTGMIEELRRNVDNLSRR